MQYNVEAIGEFVFLESNQRLGFGRLGFRHFRVTRRTSGLGSLIGTRHEPQSEKRKDEFAGRHGAPPVEIGCSQVKN